MSSNFISGTELTAESLNSAFGHHVDCAGGDQMYGPVWLWNGDGIGLDGTDYLQGACRGWVTNQIITYVNDMINTPPDNTYFLPISGGVLKGDLSVGTVKPDGTTTRVYFAPYAPANGSIGWTGGDGGGLSACGYTFAAFNGIGFPTTCAAQRMPIGLNGVVIQTRNGDLYTYGKVQARGCIVNDIHQFGMLRIYRSDTVTQTINLSGNIGACVITDAGGAPVSGGTGVGTNDRFYDQYGNTYTCTAASGGVATALRMDQVNIAVGAITNPVALTAAPGYSGTGVTINLSQQFPTTLQLWTAAGCDIYLNHGTNARVRADPTIPLGICTKQYADKMLPLAGGTVTGNVTFSGRTGFNNATPPAKPTVTGAKGSNAALASLLTALASYGLVTDSTTA